ncbi:hypothetical protein ACTXMW_08480 [Brachybacterium paraconglomeratum]|uniref:hypothetical protein n=1 Tax=Brachybacterium paraconglomeratum TaxID=173362 RepID=UPI003FCFAD61
MNAVLSLLPLLVAAVLAVALVVTIVQIWARYQHPMRLALQAVGAASLMGVIGLAGLLPDALWWVSWVLALAILLGIAFSARRLLVGAPPSDPSPRKAELLDPPPRSSALIEVLFWLALVVVALIAG